MWGGAPKKLGRINPALLMLRRLCHHNLGNGARESTNHKEIERKGMPGGVPKNLSHRHVMMAYLVASGMRRGEIARRMAYYPTTVSHIMRSPDFQALVAEFQREVQAKMVASVVDWVAGRGTPT